MAINLGGLLKTLTSQYEETRAKKKSEYKEAKDILQNVVEMFGPGYLKGEEKKILADVEQGMAGRGLGGTTRPAAVSTGIKAQIRDRATKGRVGAMTNIANLMSGWRDVYPDPGTLAHLATGGFSSLLQKEIAKAPGSPLGPLQYSAGTGSQVGGPTYMAKAANLMNPVTQTEPTTAPWTGGASATVGFGPSTSAPATGAGAATYGVGGGLSPWQQQQASESWWRGVQ